VETRLPSALAPAFVDTKQLELALLNLAGTRVTQWPELVCLGLPPARNRPKGPALATRGFLKLSPNIVSSGPSLAPSTDVIAHAVAPAVVV
jgi:hypothetical protein